MSFFLRRSASPQRPAFPRRRLVVTLLADLAVIGAFIAVAVLNLVQVSGGAGGQPLPEFEPMMQVVPVPSPAQTPEPAPGALRLELRSLMEEQETNVGLAVLDSEGGLLLEYESERPFVLASVAKLYILVAYLHDLEQRGVQPSDADMALLEPMIRVSSNYAASTLWRMIGREEGLAAFLESQGLPVVTTVEAGAWGTLSVTAGQVAELLWRLQAGELLSPELTQLALGLLSDIHDEQSWGVTAGLTLPGSIAFFKNGWYPEVEGWRVNSAGAVQTPEDDYVLVVLTDSAPSFESGIALVEDIAWRINAFMAR